MDYLIKAHVVSSFFYTFKKQSKSGPSCSKAATGGVNDHPADSVVCFVNIYPLDSDLSGG